ncbi:MAG: hypothetical protein KZQ83_19885 [gamma proteobacterium symbiont of Taylorina sp.]|nr:hypothetical protein [gamma proteobacterium symbiont of Taylorina sp.]
MNNTYNPYSIRMNETANSFAMKKHLKQEFSELGNYEKKTNNTLHFSHQTMDRKDFIKIG